MRRPGLLDTTLNLALGAAVVLAAVLLAGDARAPRIELSRVRLTNLDDGVRQRLANLADRVDITYFVSPREQMPSHMRRVERDVTDLLAAMEQASGGKLHVQILDPTSDPAVAAYAARRKVTPVRVRHVSRDAFTEQEVWSTLTLTHGPRPPAVVRGVGPEHLPRLQRLLLAHLDELAAPTRPVFGLSAPEGFTQLREALEAKGQVIEVDPGSGQPLPDDMDLLVWMDPGEVTGATLRQLDRLLERGRSLLVAGAEVRPRLIPLDGTEALVVEPTGFDAQTLMGHFGLEVATDLLLDERSMALPGPDGEAGSQAPYRITCIANNQDFQQMAGECNATLLFETPSALHLRPEVLAEKCWRADVIGTSSERSWARTWDGRPIPLSELPAKTGNNRPKEALMVRLRHADPWHGQVLLMAADSPFRDGSWELPGTGHGKLLRVLVDTLASADGRVAARAGIQRAAPLPQLAPASRTGWRAFTVLFLPLGLWVLSRVRRGRQRAGGGMRLPMPPWIPGLALRGVAGLVLVAALVAFLPAGHDLTRDGRNALHPTTLALADTLLQRAPLQIELVFSGPERLPASLRRPVADLAGLAADIARAVPGVSVSRIRPEDLDEAGREALLATGLSPLKVTSRDEESTTVRTVWSAAAIRCGDRTELLPFADGDAFEHAEFRLAFAFQRLLDGRRRVVAVAADNPRLSAAEAHEEFQKKHLIAPTGTDPYDAARKSLSAVDFEVIQLDPRNPVLDVPVDALLWLQPRRAVNPMLTLLVDYMYRGGRALVAAQHFNIQARQYRGRGFDFVHWPQPQTPDIEQLWLSGLGIELVREVLFDELNLPISDEAQIAGDKRRDFKAMQTSLPFVLRAVGANYAPGSALTAGLGDQAFVWSSFFRTDAARLSQLGLSAEPFISTSERAWSFLWSGGWLPPEVLEGPLPGTDGTVTPLGKVPLALDVRGQFPWPGVSFDPPRSEDEGPAPYPVPEPTEAAAPGRLLLLGCSEVFKSRRLVDLRPDFRGDHLLLNAVADLALPRELQQVMTRRRVASGFDVLDEDERLRWRALVVFSVPALLFLGSALHRLLGGR